MASVLDTLAAITQETLSPQVDQFILGISPFFRRVFRDSRNVFRDPDMGEGWKVRKIFQTGLGGAFEYQGMTTNALLSTTDTGAPMFNVYGNTSQHVWPGADVSGAPGYFRWLVTLGMGLGNMHMPLELLRHAELPAKSVMADQFTNIIKATARTVAYGVVNPFFAESATSPLGLLPTLFGILSNFAIANNGATTINGVNLTLNVRQVSVQLLLSAGGSVRRLTDGMRVDLWWDNAGVWTLLNTTGPLFLTHVDPLSHTFRLVNMGTAAQVFVAATTYRVTPHRAYGDAVVIPTSVRPFLPMGLERFLISTGTLFGSSLGATDSINLANAPFFRSYLQGPIGAALDENVLRRIVARVAHSRDNTLQIDTLLGSEGLWSAYADNLDGMYTIERNGRLLDIKAGLVTPEDDGTFMFFNAFGQKWRCMWDPWPAAGTLYGLKTNDRNFKMMVPPRMPGSTTRGEFDQGVEFVWKVLSGSNGIFAPVFDNMGNLTNMVQAPFYYPFEFVPDVIPGLKITGLTEDYAPLLP